MTDQQLSALATYKEHNAGCSGLRCQCDGCQLARKILAERDAKVWPKGEIK